MRFNSDIWHNELLIKKEGKMKSYPKDCINNKCKNILYVEKHELHLCLICEKCQGKKRLKKEAKV